MTRYGIYRVGSNAANQGMRARQLVAVVEASSREAAVVTERSGSGLWDSAYAALAPDVTVWANQRLEAIPLSRVPARDLRELNESTAGY